MYSVYSETPLQLSQSQTHLTQYRAVNFKVPNPIFLKNEKETHGDFSLKILATLLLFQKILDSPFNFFPFPGIWLSQDQPWATSEENTTL